VNLPVVVVAFCPFRYPNPLFSFRFFVVQFASKRPTIGQLNPFHKNAGELLKSSEILNKQFVKIEYTVFTDFPITVFARCGLVQKFHDCLLNCVQFIWQNWTRF
jgi:hypothetical protein